MSKLFCLLKKAAKFTARKLKPSMADFVTNALNGVILPIPFYVPIVANETYSITPSMAMKSCEKKHSVQNTCKWQYSRLYAAEMPEMLALPAVHPGQSPSTDAQGTNMNDISDIDCNEPEMDITSASAADAVAPFDAPTKVL